MKKHLYTKKYQTRSAYGQSMNNELTHTHLFILKSKSFLPYDSINLHLFLAEEELQSKSTGYYSISAFDQDDTVDPNYFFDSKFEEKFNSSKKENNLIIKKIAFA